MRARRRSVCRERLEKLRASAGLVKYTTIQLQIRQINLESVDLFVPR